MSDAQFTELKHFLERIIRAEESNNEFLESIDERLQKLASLLINVRG